MDKATILSRLDKSAFYKRFLSTLKLKGKEEGVSLCPFHPDTHPSLNINLSSGLFHCFSCGAGGDVFSFYQKYKNVDFKTALREIGCMVGVESRVSKGTG